MTQRAHGEGVTSLGKEMDFCWNACLVQRSRIDGAVANRIDRIVPSLKKKCRRGHLGDFDSRIKRAPRSAQVAREHCDGKIGPAAHFVYRSEERRVGKECVSTGGSRCWRFK